MMAPSAAALADYVAVVHRGVSVRARARVAGTPASTVSRRVGAVEAAREHPELGAVVGAAEAAQVDRLRVALVAPAVCDALGAPAGAARSEIASWCRAHGPARMVFLANDKPMAVATREGERIGTLRRPILLSGLALQLLRCADRGAPVPAVRRFVPVMPREALPDQARIMGVLAYINGRRRSDRFFDPPHIEAARRLLQLHAMEAHCAGALETALAPLPRDARRAVEAVICEGLGIEELERAEGWPARSGKLALRIGLEGLDLAEPVPFGGPDAAVGAA